MIDEIVPDSGDVANPGRDMQADKKWDTYNRGNQHALLTVHYVLEHHFILEHYLYL